MCRLMVYKGSDEILLSKLITEPSHSILTQSFAARLRLDKRRPHNGDGFGVGYYTDPKFGPEPCIFTSTIPAWNCNNLARLASKTSSSLIFAHVRASTEGNLSDQNCHPFTYNSLMFMHNGGIGDFKHIKQDLMLKLDKKWYLTIKGSTDSETAFALFLHCLARGGTDPDRDPGPYGFGHKALRSALLETISIINEYTSALEPELRKDPASLLNFAVADGHDVVCSRYVSSKTQNAATLFFSSGTSWTEPQGESEREKGEYKMERRDRGADIVLVASEPLTYERNNWVTVPINSILTIHKQTVMIHPIKDEFYDEENYERSDALMVSMGQKTLRSPQPSGGPSPAAPVAGPRSTPGFGSGGLATRLRELKITCN